jgi:3-hydroxyacyl-[acyl-carrier-protein] dehydratase
MSQEIKKFGPFDHVKVMNYLPHRYPFLFVDKILGIEVPVGAGGKLEQMGTKVIGQKNATINEPYFSGHFPSLPITPGVIMIETMAQIASFGIYPWLKTDDSMKILGRFDLRLAGVDGIRFRRPFFPGDSLIVTMQVIKHRGPIWVFNGRGEVDGHVVVEGEIMASVDLGDTK